MCFNMSSEVPIVSQINHLCNYLIIQLISCFAFIQTNLSVNTLLVYGFKHQSCARLWRFNFLKTWWRNMRRKTVKIKVKIVFLTPFWKLRKTRIKWLNLYFFFLSNIYTLCFSGWVTEVRSKILTPLETTGGKSFSLEGFEKMLFTI